MEDIVNPNFNVPPTCRLEERNPTITLGHGFTLPGSEREVAKCLCSINLAIIVPEKSILGSLK